MPRRKEDKSTFYRIVTESARKANPECPAAVRRAFSDILERAKTPAGLQEISNWDRVCSKRMDRAALSLPATGGSFFSPRGIATTSATTTTAATTLRHSNHNEDHDTNNHDNKDEEEEEEEEDDNSNKSTNDDDNDTQNKDYDGLCSMIPYDS
eukprot:Skav206779  [mRNA]  locus=scaffold1075:144148:146374:+ [translate_table: standard]